MEPPWKQHQLQTKHNKTWNHRTTWSDNKIVEILAATLTIDCPVLITISELVKHPFSHCDQKNKMASSFNHTGLFFLHQDSKQFVLYIQIVSPKWVTEICYS